MSSASTFSLPFSSEARFIHFDLAAQKIVRFRSEGHDRLSDHRDRLESHGIADPDLLRDLSGRDFEFEQFKDLEPCFRRDFDFVELPAREIMEGIAASGATIFGTANPVDFIAATLCAKNMAFSPAKTSKVEPRPIFCLNNEFKGIQVHGHHYNLVQNLL